MRPFTPAASALGFTVTCLAVRDAAACTFCATELSAQVRRDVFNADFWLTLTYAGLALLVTGAILALGYIVARPRASPHSSPHPSMEQR